MSYLVDELGCLRTLCTKIMILIKVIMITDIFDHFNAS